MREILGRRRVTRSSLRNAALHCATRWQWPVLPGAAVRPDPPAATAGRADPSYSCSCADVDCVVPGAHPRDPVLLAATTDARMIDWWWRQRPDASLLLATGTAAGGRRAPCALSLPAAAGARALADFDRLRVRLGPVIATPTRRLLLVEPYELAELGELLHAQDRIPTSLRFHGDGGYVPLPPSPAVNGQARWERRPVSGHGRGRRGDDHAGAGGRGASGGRAPWLPRTETLLKVLVAASATEPDTGSRLAY